MNINNFVSAQVFPLLFLEVFFRFIRRNAKLLETYCLINIDCNYDNHIVSVIKCVFVRSEFFGKP